MKKILLKSGVLAALLLAQAVSARCLAQTAAEADTATWAVPLASVVNVRCAGDYGGEMETQALLGMPLKILKNDRWMRVMTPDGDNGYVLYSSLKTMTDGEMRAWNAAPQVVVTSHLAFVHAKPNGKSQRVGDVVAACRLKLLGKQGAWYRVAYPDGREGYLSMADGMPLDKWQKNVKQDAQSIIATGMTLNGVPYQWGGTSTKAVDCSGFVRTTLLMHGITLPRNASQQAKVGQHIDIAPDFGNLQPGDLVFFGRKADGDKPAHVSHVGIYIGNKKFVHSLAWVHVSSFDPADAEYDEYDLNRLLWAQRVLPLVNTIPEVMTNDKNEFYNFK